MWSLPRRKRTYIPIARRYAGKARAAAWNLSNTTETGASRTVNTESPLTILGSYFCSAPAGIQMRPPKYVDIMDINIFIWHAGVPALCAPINHVAVILITFRIESAFPMLPPPSPGESSDLYATFVVIFIGNTQSFTHIYEKSYVYVCYVHVHNIHTIIYIIQ